MAPVSKGEEKAPLTNSAVRGRRLWRTVGPDIPCAGCFPAEPDSVSPDMFIVESRDSDRNHLDTGVMP
jgi:hypothetical protein